MSDNGTVTGRTDAPDPRIADIIKILDASGRTYDLGKIESAFDYAANCRNEK